MIQINKSVIVVTAHKVGSTWLRNIIADLNIYGVMDVPDSLRKNIKNPSLIDLDNKDCPGFLDSLGVARVFKSHSLPVEWIKSSTHNFVTIFRDPRDVVISNIYYLASLDKEKGGHAVLNSMNNTQRIRWYLDKQLIDLELLEEWYACDFIYKIKYEDMLENTQKTMNRLLKSMELSIETADLKAAIKRNTFFAKSGRRPGEEDKGKFFRKGISGDWRNYFDEELKVYFKNSNNGRWNDILIRMGYETNSDW